jgi:hypothetical protein
MLDGKYITERFHPEFPELRILNYTEKAAFEGVWNRVTLNSRGLIYNADTHEVIWLARSRSSLTTGRPAHRISTLTLALIS